MNLAIAKMQRRDEIIGDALGAQIMQNRIIHEAIGIGESLPQRLADSSATARMVPSAIAATANSACDTFL
jgi:hypothetical protein